MAVQPLQEATQPLDRLFERLGEIHELRHLAEVEAERLADPLLDSRLETLKRAVVAAGDRVAQLRHADRARGTWLEEASRSAES